jgi:lysozyme
MPLILRLSALLLGLAILLVACGDSTSVKTPVIRPVAGLPAQFGDTDPHPWRGRAPKTYPVHGVDVARYQNAVDWKRAAANGIRFSYVKATEGGDRVDPNFKTNWNASARAGIPRGAYHFFYFCRPAIEQAEWFIRNVPRTKGALPPVLDIEWNHTSPTCRLHPPADQVRAEMRIFRRALHQHYGQKPLIYTTVDFYHQNDLAQLRGHEFWLRSVAAHPSKIYPGAKWTFWQYTGSGLAPGFGGEVDLNAFHGSEAEWKNWLATHR